ncbi:HK97 family phage prohead protease [Methylophaga sp.]|uniref:HK97 family phage prohead protease n=1 Tax=Methylophaga sp. TaxID=2024840 RepID=UPI003A8EA551
MEMETRTFNCELRADPMESGSVLIKGSAAVFNKRSELMMTPWGEPFREVIKPGAFDTVLEDDVRGLFNHDHNYVLGRSASKTLRLAVTDSDLNYEIDAPKTQTINDLVIEPMKRGDVSQSSFAFAVANDGDFWEYDDDDGVLLRTITKVKRLFDVSPVTFPAYSDADSSLSTRSLEQFKEKQKTNPDAQWRNYVANYIQTL